MIAQGTAPYWTVTDGKLASIVDIFLRTPPNAESKALSKVPRGSKIKVMGKGDIFYLVLVGEAIGYISKYYLKGK